MTRNNYDLLRWAMTTPYADKLRTRTRIVAERRLRGDTLKSIAFDLGITSERVRQKEREACLELGLNIVGGHIIINDKWPRMNPFTDPELTPMKVVGS